jgi:hypothetical protein
VCGAAGNCAACGRRSGITGTDALGHPIICQQKTGTRAAEKLGGYEDGLFCGLRCGYQWAVRHARPAREKDDKRRERHASTGL